MLDLRLQFTRGIPFDLRLQYLDARFELRYQSVLRGLGLPQSSDGILQRRHGPLGLLHRRAEPSYLLRAHAEATLRFLEPGGVLVLESLHLQRLFLEQEIV